MTNYEQNSIIQPTWDRLNTIGFPDMTAKLFSILAKNPCWPEGDDFINLFGGQGDLSNMLQRWEWIAISNVGILATWNSQPGIGQESLA